MDKRIWWAILPERNMYDVSYRNGLRLAYAAGRRGHIPIYAQYGRTDVTRQGMCEVFLQMGARPDDTLVMLDVDHEHPIDIIDRLARHDVPVCVPLMFRRQEPYQACAFRRGADGALHHLASFPPGLLKMDAVGSGAIAIQRRALTKILDAGLGPWLFKYEYLETNAPSEDMYFSKLCEKAGVEMYVDTTIETPHITLGFIDRGVYDSFIADHPDEMGELLEIKKEVERANFSDNPE